jgi:hypothetical protein
MIDSPPTMTDFGLEMARSQERERRRMLLLNIERAGEKKLDTFRGHPPGRPLNRPQAPLQSREVST